jgi:hypothetical protein
MIAITDTAVKSMLETRYNMPAIFSIDADALKERGDIRFQLPAGIEDEGGEISSRVKFPFCIWCRDQGTIDEARFNIAQARDGVEIGIRNEDQTKARFLKMIPMRYPYSVRYYVSSISQSIRLEKRYWGLKVEFTLYADFPPESDERLHTLMIRINTLTGFEPPKTDVMYTKGRYYTGNMNFSVDTWIIEGVDIPIVQKILFRTYDRDVLTQLDNFSYDQRIWRP